MQAAYAILLARFPAQAADLNAKREASLAAMGGAQDIPSSQGIEWGQSVAEAILAWRSTDGFTPAPPPYVGGLNRAAGARLRPRFCLARPRNSPP